MPEQDTWLKLNLTPGALVPEGLGVMLVLMMCSAALCPPLTQVINLRSFPSPQ